MTDLIVIPLLKIVFILVGVIITVLYLVLLERKIQAWIQVRLGPMRVGPHGILQTVADVLKLFLKEDITPARADWWVYTAAPIVVVSTALIAFAVVPFGNDVSLFGKKISLGVADVNVGLLYIVAVASIGVYGIILGGWASNSKYPLLGSLRASAQLISYELAVTITFVSVILVAGTLSMVGIVNAQYNSRIWYVFVQPVAFVIYFIAGLAETNRVPFDLPEAESELVAGYHTEYSGMRFALFFLAEVHEHDCRLVGGDHAVPRRLAAAVPERPGAGVSGLGAELDVVHPEDDAVSVPLPVDPRHAAALPVRPAHARGLEGPDSPGDRQHCRDRRREGPPGQLIWVSNWRSTACRRAFWDWRSR